MIDFGEWLPDQQAIASPLQVAKNVIPSAVGYSAVKNLGSFSLAGDSRIQGLFSKKDSTGSVELYAGDAGKLYRFNASNSQLDDVSKSGGYSLGTDQYWNFCVFGNKIIVAGDTSQRLQFIESGGSAFADLSATAPQARYVAVVRDFVVTGYSGGESRVTWSAINDETSWTAGTSQSDFQDIPDQGHVKGLVGGEYGIIFMDNAIVRMTYVGSPLIFQFDTVETKRGLAFEGAYASLSPSEIFYLAEDGFYFWNGQQSIPIGAEKVNKFFYDDLKISNADRITASIDPTRSIVAWGYPTGDGNPDRILFYNYAVKRWSFAEVTHDMLGSFQTPAYTLEALDNVNSSIDDLTFSLDSRAFRGGQFVFGGAKDNAIAFFTEGVSLPAQLVLGEKEFATGRLTNINRIYPYFDGGTITVTLKSRNTMSNNVDTGIVGLASLEDPFTDGTAGSLNNEGFIPTRSNGRFHTIQFDIDNAFSGAFEKISGYELDIQVLGRR